MNASLVADIELAAAIMLDGAFLAGFLARSQWRSRTGAFLLTFATVIETLMCLRLYARVVWPLGDGFWAVGFAALDVVFGWLVYLLWRGHDYPRIHLGGIMRTVRRISHRKVAPRRVAVATQSRHPWRATGRTVAAALIALASLLPVIVVTGGLEAVPGVAQVLVVAGTVTRILALPQVDWWLRRYAPWLAPDPASRTDLQAGAPTTKAPDSL